MASGPPTVISTIQDRIASVPRPRPILSRERTRAFTPRQTEILDQLGAIVVDGFAEITMADVAKALGCSLRTLYEIAPSRDELVLAMVDRHLWQTGRSASHALPSRLGAADVTAVDAVRTYLASASRAVSATTEKFARDLAAVPEAQALNQRHAQYLTDITTCLLDLAVEQGEIDPVDTSAVARVLANVGRDFAHPDAIGQIASTPKEAADQVVDIVLAGLVSGSTHNRSTT